MAPAPEDQIANVLLVDRASPTFPGIHHNTLPAKSPKNPNYNPASGSINPHHINNHVFFALFALLGVAIALTMIWFFFWAKNGGFVWQKGDWEEYKSTVLRRKGPDGKTLSNATPRTDLGGRSIAGTWDNQTVRDEKAKHLHEKGKRNSRVNYNDVEAGIPRRYERTRQPSQPNHSSHQHVNAYNFDDQVDNDVQEYRRERPARVGGLNRASDGSHFDSASGYSSGTPSVVSDNSRTHLTGIPPKQQPKGKMAGLMERQQKWRAAALANRARASGALPTNKKRADKSNIQRERRTQRQNNDKTASGRVRPSRQRLNETFADRSPIPSRNTAVKSKPNPVRAARTPGSFDAYSDAGSDVSGGTRSYAHHIPGLSARPGLSGLRASTSANRNTNTGYRRDAFGGRRDSLSDSDLD